MIVMHVQRDWLLEGEILHVGTVVEIFGLESGLVSFFWQTRDGHHGHVVRFPLAYLQEHCA